jgi:hypothetical protein
MPKELTRVEDVLRAQVPAAGAVSDGQVTITCPSCQTRQTLGEASVHHEHRDTTYACTKKCQIICIVSDPMRVELPGRGHRFGDLMIRNVTELEVDLAGAAPMKIAAQPAALEAISGRTLKYRI